jgi:uncharacterized lipoprotein
MKRELAGVAVVAVLAACGGSSGMTKADYVKQANRVCHDAATSVAALKLPDTNDVTTIPVAAKKIVVAQRSALERLKAIKPPKADRPAITKWIALIDQTIDQAEVSAQSQEDGDIQRAITANVNGAALDARADQIAKAFGLKTCVQAAAAPPGSGSLNEGKP